jgi:phospholipid/cholesterol/gamma-HCH transport system substrate-binding protein
MKPFRERNPVVVGAASLAVLAMLLLAAFQAQNLPLIGGGDRYVAAFTEAGGLKVNDEVRIAGVRVGQVEDITLEDGEVKVGFRIKSDSAFGEDTAAAIRVRTVLGAMYLALLPAGTGQLEAGTEIPTSRTSPPFDVVQAFSGLAETAQQIDTDQLTASLTTLADLTRNTPEEFRTALTGLSRLSANLAAKDEQINDLLVNLDRVSTVLGERDDDIIALMQDAEHADVAALVERDRAREARGQLLAVIAAGEHPHARGHHEAQEHRRQGESAYDGHGLTPPPEVSPGTGGRFWM